MGRSNAPGETRVRTKNDVTLMVQIDLSFTDQALNDAPQWDRTALTLLRTNINKFEADLIEDIKKVSKDLINAKVTDVNIRAI